MNFKKNFSNGYWTLALAFTIKSILKLKLSGNNGPSTTTECKRNAINCFRDKFEATLI
jgi:hypothetical protein